MQLRSLLADRRVAIGWLVASTLGLAAAASMDPYVFAVSAYAAAMSSAVLVAGCAALARRNVLWALLSAVPTGAAFVFLAGFNWA